ncbi:MAG: hypothetical protein H7838_11760 [Magnetococcus sp. DMHC-8]
MTVAVTAADRRGSAAPPPRRVAPVAVRLLLLALLPLLVALLYWRGQQYDPSLLDFKSGGSALTALLPRQVDLWQREPTLRQFGKENLYEYVNGHAEYFLGAGFRALVVAEYRLPTDTRQPSLVVDLYDMGEPLSAFGVLMDENGATGRPVAVGDAGLQGERSIGFIAGPYYVKLAAFADHLPIEGVAQAVHQALGKGPQASGKASLVFAFPELGTVTATRFVKENYHGWRFLQRVVERHFQRADGTVIQAFRVPVAPQQKADLEQQFLAFFRQEGTAVTETKEADLRILQIADRYEGDWLLVPLEGFWLGVFHPLDEDLRGALQAFARRG